ncbi:PTEN-induced putative kinase 1 isoform X2 [Oratosquilla oratoria]|uniref:PTEN-induced putative kinase 1 isoform X2 n=1 Tax=Oratosquilla oratoria TaxID=337810 RepID=UPI003F774769
MLEARLGSGPTAADSATVAGAGAVGTGVGGFAFSERVVGSIRPVASRLFEGLVRKVSAPLWSEAKRHTTKRLFYGETAPFFALVGVTLGSESQQGLITKQDELEALCADIRDAVAQVGWLFESDDGDCLQEDHEEKCLDEFLKTGEEIKGKLEHKYSLRDFTLGTVIDKGCNAVVYAARWNAGKEKRDVTSFVEDNTNPLGNNDISSPPCKRQRADDVPKMGQEFEQSDMLEVHELQKEEEKSSYDFSTSLGEASAPVLVHASDSRAEGYSSVQSGSDQNISCSSRHVCRSNITDEVNHLLCSGAIRLTETSRQRVNYDLKKNEEETNEKEKPPDPSSKLQKAICRDQEIRQYPLAVKMMFNYDIQSNAPAILRAMYRELIPAKHIQLDECHCDWQEMFQHEMVALPQHPNIVKMPCVFVDSIPMLKDSLSLFPDALPARLNPLGFGRNKSLFCVMKRYHMSLHDYLVNYDPPVRTSVMLLAQLLEAVLHINSNNVVHRDLKADNILISLKEGWQYPFLIVSDFGCCMADPSLNMTVPFASREADPRQGNAALMAPEVKTAVPGLLRSICYQLADVWAVGALAYEIFGVGSPFFTQSNQKGTKCKVLDSANYKESQLPNLPRDVPSTIKHLVRDLLHRNPKNRPSVEVAATLCQLVLWAPSKWLNRHSFTLPSHTEVMQWLLCLTTKVLCESRSYQGQGGQPERQGGQVEYKMVSTFLARVQYKHIIQAIKWNRAF